MSGSAEWPGDSQAAVACATRVVMLSAASRTCPIGVRTAEQDALLALVATVTRHENAQGHTFDTFLEYAQSALVQAAHAVNLAGAVQGTLSDIAACVPRDLIGEVFAALVEMTSVLYNRPLSPALVRSVMSTGDFPRPKAVEGKVLRGSNEVELLVYYSAGFDLETLALVPRVLAHELICHVGGKYTGVWKTKPSPDVREYFTDGFMDRAAYLLLSFWSMGQTLPRLTPPGMLGVREWANTAERPRAFKAGAAAFDNCVSRTSEQLTPTLAQRATTPAHAHANALDASLRAAVRMNTCASHITGKDWFVHYALDDGSETVTNFALVARDDAEPSWLFDVPTA